jgi:hypothetical protein
MELVYRYQKNKINNCLNDVYIFLRTLSGNIYEENEKLCLCKFFLDGFIFLVEFKVVKDKDDSLLNVKLLDGDKNTFKSLIVGNFNNFLKNKGTYKPIKEINQGIYTNPTNILTKYSIFQTGYQLLKSDVYNFHKLIPIYEKYLEGNTDISTLGICIIADYLSINNSYVHNLSQSSVIHIVKYCKETIGWYENHFNSKFVTLAEKCSVVLEALEKINS